MISTEVSDSVGPLAYNFPRVMELTGYAEAPDLEWIYATGPK